MIMKKIIVIAAFMLGFAFAAVAQPRAIGGRLGNGAEVSYQHTLGQNFLEIDGGAGLDIYNAGHFNLGATGIYNIMIAQPQWTDQGEWGFYAGPGAGLGLGIGNDGDGTSITILLFLQPVWWVLSILSGSLSSFLWISDSISDSVSVREYGSLQA